MTVSRFEANILRQPELIARALAAPTPTWFKPPRGRRVWLIGVGSNHHAAQLAAWLWSASGIDARAVHSFDVSRGRTRLERGDWAVFLSHRGGRSCTVAAEAAARRAGAATFALTAQGSRWTTPRRLDTGPLEDTGAFTHSVTSALAWLCRWPGDPRLLAPFRNARRALAWGPAFPGWRTDADVVLIGDGPREWIARETALKLQETSYTRARAFGLEEFLHGPQISVSPGATVVAFSSPREPRWSAARAWLSAVGIPMTEAKSENWLAQIIWGQRLAAHVCRRLGIDPDATRLDDPRYRRARAALDRAR